MFVLPGFRWSELRRAGQAAADRAAMGGGGGAWCGMMPRAVVAARSGGRAQWWPRAVVAARSGGRIREWGLVGGERSSRVGFRSTGGRIPSIPRRFCEKRHRPDGGAAAMITAVTRWTGIDNASSACQTGIQQGCVLWRRRVGAAVFFGSDDGQHDLAAAQG